MTDRDIIVIRTKDYAFEHLEEFSRFVEHVQMFDDDKTKFIVIPNQIVEEVERL